MTRRPIADRIRDAMRGRTEAPYHEVLFAVFPPSEYPNAHRRSCNGGPPGCAMAFRVALRRLGGHGGSGGLIWFKKPLTEVTP